MSKFSVVMLVSRTDKKFRAAVESVAAYEPDEFRAYIDTVKIDYMREPWVWKFLRDHNAKILRQRAAHSSDHHEKIVHNYHRAILNAAHEWVIKFDDDDVLLGPDRHELIATHGHPKVGLIHGDKVVSYPYWEYFRSFQWRQLLKSMVKPLLFQGKPCEAPQDMRGRIWSGTCILRKEAFEQIHPRLDHGYFYDWKTFYWILRAGWKAKYVPKIMFRHNISPSPSAARKAQWGRWPGILARLEKQPLEI